MGLLEQVVATGGGQKAKVRGYRVAGKTGTAQKVREDGTGYSEGRYIASFLGFGPVENPRIALLVMINDPSGVFYGGQIAAPVASRIFSQVFRYMKIEPSETPPDENEYIPDDVGEGDSGGNVVRTYTPPKVEEHQIEDDTTHEDATEESTEIIVPDFYGRSIRESARLANNAGLTLDTEGSGFAVEQSIAAGTPVERGTVIKVIFSPG